MSGTPTVGVVVEDDDDIRELIATTLTMKGLTVHTAATGREGLELIGATNPDLVTLDIGLPDLDGIEVCRQVRAVSDAYIVLISGRTDEVDRLMGLETGADDYLTKPFSPRELQARVTAMFRRPRRPTAWTTRAAYPDAQTADGAAGDGVVVLGKLAVDLESRSVTVDETDVELTRTEFELLAVMVGAPRRVWARDVLLRRVWGEDWGTDEHLVEVHVGNLRRKLGGATGSASLIRTVRGVGYRMEEPSAVWAD
ncbi:response regulator transcription factor [Nostocoides sp. HKS02]|uniref:response regulator transcription factor n=1 Tax=Nostocoides sp. HKS02 TaxID=1813880 RepID=UPI001E320313|nr:response regulator transcription factor [Tetrasphaera sp. HKS02]